MKAEPLGAAQTIRWYAEALDKLYGEIAPTADNVLALIQRVRFQHVAHSGRIGETGVTTHSSFRSASNEHPRDCPNDANSSSGDGSCGYLRWSEFGAGQAGLWGFFQDRCALDAALQDGRTRGDARPDFAAPCV